MADSMTYNSLIQDMQTYAERSDSSYVSQIPRFIMMAENRIASEVRGLGYLRYVTGTMNMNDPILPKPARWRETSTVMIYSGDNQAIFLYQRGYAYCKSYWPNKALTQQPEYYADYGYEHLLVVPTPDTNYQFEMAYHERPIPLGNTNQVNWTTQYAPQLILYASLLEAQPWLKLDDRLPIFQSLYDQAKAAVTMEAERRLNGDESLQRNNG